MRFLIFLLLVAPTAGAQPFSKQVLTPRQDSIFARYATNGAQRHSYLSAEWQQQLDEGLKLDSAIADMWQMKAMPLFKTRKYELGMEYLDRAVRYDSAHWLPYRAFIKTIFSKQYRSGLEDLEFCRQRLGNDHVMDHPFDVWRALCHLQLNEFAAARTLLERQASDDEAHGRTHHLRQFYLGIARMETGDHAKALAAFDRAIALFPQFSDAHFYRGKCLGFLGRNEDGLKAVRTGKAFYDKGYTINEDNSFYELYPYQVAWRWKNVR